MTDKFHKVLGLGYQNAKDLAALVRATKNFHEEGAQAVLVDVRLKPRSRIAQWNKGNIQAECSKQGVTYVWIQDLGNVNYKQAHAGIKLLNQKQGMEMLASLAKNNPIFIMCTCWSYNKCHRWNVLRAWESFAGLKLGDSYDLEKAVITGLAGHPPNEPRQLDLLSGKN